MKKKTVANIIMVAIIMVIVAAGIIGVGHIKGWFDFDNGSQAVLCEMRGVINLEREGVSYPVEEDTVLRQGDKITCNSGATAKIRVGNDSLTIGEKAVITISDPAADSFAADIVSGEVFANCDGIMTLSFAEQEITMSKATALFSVRTGAQSISVFRGLIEDAAASQMLSYIGSEKTIAQLDIKSLNDFTITQIRSANGSMTLCFTNEDLDQLMADRQAAMQELIDSQTKLPETDPTTPTDDTTVPTETDDGKKPTENDTTKPTQSTTPPETQATTPSQDTTPPETTVTPETTAPVETTEPTETTAPPETTEPDSYSCTITIRCDTILNNMDSLNPGKAGYVPSNGVILSSVSVEFTEGETVFDILKRVCNATGIQLEYSMSSYGSYYVEGINNLYEFDCGAESGWMYKVNGWFPNYGCSEYTLKDGDVIVWAYSCQGLGADVGAPAY